MMKIFEDDLSDGKVESLLESHLAEMQKYSPQESIHALDKKALHNPAITFWSLRIDDQLAGCGALKQLSPDSAEIKSMKTAPAFLRRGVAAKTLEHMIATAQSRGYLKLFLETGSHEAFMPAILLYQKYGFIERECFGEYKPDPFSRFFELAIAN